MRRAASLEGRCVASCHHLHRHRHHHRRRYGRHKSTAAIAIVTTTMNTATILYDGRELEEPKLQDLKVWRGGVGAKGPWSVLGVGVGVAVWARGNQRVGIEAGGRLIALGRGSTPYIHTLNPCVSLSQRAGGWQTDISMQTGHSAKTE